MDQAEVRVHRPLLRGHLLPVTSGRSTTPENRRGPQRARGVHRRAARAGGALPQPPPVPCADGRGRAHARGAAALGRQPLLLPARASRSRTRRSSRTAPRSTCAASGSSGSLDHDGTAAGTAGSSRGCGSARRSACRATSSSPSGTCCPAVRYAVDAYVNFARQQAMDRGGRLVADGALRPERDPRRASQRSRRTTRGSIRPASSTSATGSCRRRATRSTRCGWSSSAAVTRERQERAVAALRFKTEVLWAQLDAIERGDTHAEASA